MPQETKSNPLEQQIAHSLAQKLSENQLVLFVGAGLSHLAPHKNAGEHRIPLWNGLSQSVAEHFGFKLQDFDNSPLDLFDAVVHQHSRGELEAIVTSSLDNHDYELSDAHNALATLPWHKIVTTNYDGLLPRLFAEPYPVVDEASYDRIHQAKIIQIHGKLPQPHTLTRDDYRNWVNKNPRAAHALQNFFLNYTVLFVGYSLSDPHLDEILALVRDWTQDRVKRHYGLFWELPKTKQDLLDKRDKMTAVSIETEDEWQNALLQLQAELNILNPSLINHSPKPQLDVFAKLKNLCEEVDFLTPLNDSHFYLGMDVQPGHLAAGLVIERPTARERILTLLESRRNIIIAGPSGSGKSALMWEVAKSAKHIEHWFRIYRLSSEQALELIQLTKQIQNAHLTTIGFVLDDIGRSLAEGWDTLSQAAASVPNLFLLSSAREEDLFLLEQRQQAYEVREMGDAELAERLWRELQKRSQSQAAGWREPWQESKGLLLEYVHILTQGSRLTDVLRSQVADRARDINREIELAILRITSAAGIAGAVIDVRRLPIVLNCSEAQVSLALRRLIDEHLLKNHSPSCVTTLHQLRATGLFHLCHEFPPPTPEQTIARTIQCLPAEDMEAFVLRISEINADWQHCLVIEIAKRLQQEPDITLATTALRGLGQAHISAHVAEWLSHPEIQTLPRTQLTGVALFGLSGNYPDLPKLRPLAVAAESFCTVIKNAANNDPRQQLMTSLSQETKANLFAQQASLNKLNQLLGAIIGTEVSGVLLETLFRIRPNLTTGTLDETATLLATAWLVDPELAVTWVDATGQQVLLDRINNEAAWVSRPTLRKEKEGLAVCADIRYIVASKQPDVHDEVVRLCELMLAFAPNAQLAIANAVAADEKIIYISSDNVPLAAKRIPRENLPPSAQVYWNRQWLSRVADYVSAPSYTDYLHRSIELLKEVASILDDVLDEWFRKGSVSNNKCERMNTANNLAETLTPPRISSYAAIGEGSTEKNEFVTELQSVLFDCSVNLIKRFAQLPEGVNPYVAWVGNILKAIDSAIEKEPWELVAKKSRQELNRLREIVEAIYLMAGESGIRNEHPINTWHKSKAQRKTAFRLAGCEVRNLTERRIKNVNTEIRQAIKSFLPTSNVFVRYKEGEIAPWPPCEVLITTPISDLADWISVVAENQDQLRPIVGIGRIVFWIPLIDGIAIDNLTISGVDTMFPRRGEVGNWLLKEKIPVVDTKKVDDFETVINSLTEISGMQKFGYGAENKPDLEKEALALAQLALAEALQRLKIDLAFNPVYQRIEKLVQKSGAGKINFALEMAASLHGNLSDVWIETVNIKNELLMLDIEDSLHPN